MFIRVKKDTTPSLASVVYQTAEALRGLTLEALDVPLSAVKLEFNERDAVIGWENREVDHVVVPRKQVLDELREEGDEATAETLVGRREGFLYLVLRKQDVEPVL